MSSPDVPFPGQKSPEPVSNPANDNGDCCRTCRFWNHVDASAREPKGPLVSTCLRNPPSVVVVPVRVPAPVDPRTVDPRNLKPAAQSFITVPQISPAWPGTEEFRWCGEHRAVDAK